MAIKLKDISPEERPPLAQALSPAGVILSNVSDDSWAAVSPRGNVSVEGQGSVSDVPPGILWVTDQRYDDARAMQDAQQRKDVRLRSCDWLRMDLGGVSAELGLSGLGLLDEATHLARVVDRVFLLSLEAARDFREVSGRQEARLFDSIDRAPSLATGMRRVMGPMIDRALSGAEAIAPHVADAAAAGAFMSDGAVGGSDDLVIRFRRPRVDHARDVFAWRVPAPGTWREAEITQPHLDEDLVEELSALDLPVIVSGRARILPDGDSLLSAWIDRPMAVSARQAFLLEEIVCMGPDLRLDHPRIFVGEGWGVAAGRRLVSEIIRVAGGEAVASASWSAGLAIENVLCGAMRSGFRGRRPVTAVENAWVAAADRILCLPFMRELSAAGGNVLMSYAGEVRVQIPADPELLEVITQVAWGNGLLMPIETRNHLVSLGVEVPDQPDTYGGSAAASLHCHMVQGGMTSAIEMMDAVIDMPPQARESRFASLMGD